MVDHDTLDTATQYNLTVTDPDPDHGSQETWRNISTDKNSPQTLDRVLDSSRLVRPMQGAPLDVQPKDGTVTVTVNGTDGPQVTETELTGVDRVTKSGIYALRNTDIFNILSVPPLDRTSQFMGSLYSAAAQLCVERRSMLVVDPPVKWTDVDAAVNNVQPFCGLRTTTPRMRPSTSRGSCCPTRTGCCFQFPPIRRRSPGSGRAQTDSATWPRLPRGSTRR